MSDSGGTQIDDVGNLLERNGVDVNRFEKATVAHLISELGQGHKIIVAIDANEVIADSLPARMVELQKDAVLERPNHAVVVVDVDPRTLDVAIVDPSDGRLHRVPVGRFIDAWQDSDCFMMATKKSPDEFFAENGSELARGEASITHGFDKHIFPIGHVAGADPQEAAIEQPRLGSLGHVAGVNSQEAAIEQPRLGSLGHVAGVNSQEAAIEQPRLGSLGQVAGVDPQDLCCNQPCLGSLGHVAGGDPSCCIDTFTTDMTENGVPDALVMDTNGDGMIDTLATFVDMNGDGLPDSIDVDLNGDGAIDVTLDPDDFSIGY